MSVKHIDKKLLIQSFMISAAAVLAHVVTASPLFSLLGSFALPGLLIYEILIAVFFCVFSRSFAPQPGERPKVKHIAAAGGIDLGLFLTGAVFAAWFHSVVEDPSMGRYAEAAAANSTLFVLLAVVFAPIVEESVYRGMVFGSLRRVLPWWASYGISALVFAMMHGTKSHLIVGFIFGLWVAYIYERTGNVLWNILAHFAYNACCFLPISVFPFMTKWFFAIPIYLVFVIIVTGLIWTRHHSVSKGAESYDKDKKQED